MLTDLGTPSRAVLSQGTKHDLPIGRHINAEMPTCVVLGFLAGMLVIGVSFVSFWKSLKRRKSATMTRTPEPYNEMSFCDERRRSAWLVREPAPERPVDMCLNEAEHARQRKHRLSRDGAGVSDACNRYY